MALIDSIIARAKSNRQRIVLPESLEERTITAADRALADGLADIILIGNPIEIKALAAKLGLEHIDKATIIDPATSEKTEEYAQLLFQLRQKKGMTIEKARELVLDPLYFGCLIIKSGDADGQISGALSTTGETLRPALQIIKCAPGISCVRLHSTARTECSSSVTWPLPLALMHSSLRRLQYVPRAQPEAWPVLRILRLQCFHSQRRVQPSTRSLTR